MSAAAAATVVPTPGGGDCLFAAVADALNAAAATAAPRCSFDKTELRRAVASRALDPADAEFTAALHTWALLWDEASRGGGGGGGGVHAHEFAHAAFLARAKRDLLHLRRRVGEEEEVLTPEVRAEIYRAMMDPRVYWGEEVAVATLERVIPANIWIYQRKRNQGGSDQEATLFREGRGGSRSFPDVLLLLDVDGQHYSSLRRVR